MTELMNMERLSEITNSILCAPFEWCWVAGGQVELIDATEYGGTKGGLFQVPDFAIAKYPLTNAQYEKFIQHPHGYPNPAWWHFSAAATQWRQDHPHPKATAFKGDDLPRTRTSWFDSMAFCGWLSAELSRMLELERSAGILVRLPTEQEWQRAALGDTGHVYPWGHQLAEKYGNYGNLVGQVSRVDQYQAGRSTFGVVDLIGNVWEWCLGGWNQEHIDVSGYTYRTFKGGAWNIENPTYLQANDRGCHPPRGRLNDCGFRVLLCPNNEAFLRPNPALT